MDMKSITKADIFQEPYQQNPIVHAILDIWMKTNISWEQAMMYAVWVLSDQVLRLEEMAQKEISTTLPEIRLG